MTCGIAKHKQEDGENPVPQDSGLLTQGWHQNDGIAYELETSLRSVGIPVTSIEHLDTSDHNQFVFNLETKPDQVASDLLFFADTYCLFKYFVKHQTVAHGYAADFIEGGALDLQMNLGLPRNWCERMHVYLPTLHSMRKVLTEDLEPSLAMLRADVNLYTVFTDILSHKTSCNETDEVCEVPKSFRAAIHHLEQISERDDYLAAFLKHELAQFYEQTESWERSRVY